MLISPGHPALRAGKLANLLDCYHRLLHYRHPADPLRMLVLMLDMRYDFFEVGKCLAAVEFEGPGPVVIDAPKWQCKAWEFAGHGVVGAEPAIGDNPAGPKWHFHELNCSGVANWPFLSGQSVFPRAGPTIQN